MKIKIYTHALIGLALFFFAFSAYGVWYTLVGKESAEVGNLQQQIQAKTQSATRTKEAKSALDRALKDEQEIKGYFVSTNDVVPFLGSLQKTGQELGAKVDVESVSSQPGNPHTTLMLSVRITGTFAAVERTLGAIEYQPYDTTITNLTFDTSSAATGAAAVWVATVTMRVGTSDTVKTATTTQP